MRKALVVVDFQNDFVCGALGFENAASLEDGIVRRMEKALADGETLIFTLDTHTKNYLDTREGKKLPVVHCIDGTDGHALYGRAADFLGRADKVIKKPTFGSMELAEFLRDGGFDAVELCGLVSNICVICNAALACAALPEAEITVNSALTACADGKLNSEALDVMRGFQVNVL